MKKNIYLLGSTGSIGTQTLDVIDSMPNKYNVKYLTANYNVKNLAQQAVKYNPETVCIVQENLKEELASYLQNTNIEITTPNNPPWKDIPPSQTFIISMGFEI